MRTGRAAKRKIRILLADREAVFRFGLKKLFGVEDDLRVVAQAGDAAELVALAGRFQPDLVYVQAEMIAEAPGGLIAELKRAMPRSNVVVVASNLSEDDSIGYVRAGASGVILKSVDAALFVKCARKVMENEVWLPKRHVAKMAKLFEARPPTRPVDTLTPRERTIIGYLLQGWRNREIARHLSITEQTVKNHLRTIYDKVGVSDRLELALYAIHQHLEVPPAGLQEPRHEPS